MPILVELTAAAPETNETSAASLQPDGSGSDLQQWRDEAMCGEHRAIDRAKWLVENQGKVMQEATLQVMREFPAAFDGAGAEEGRDSFITSASPRPARRRCSRRPDGSNQRRVPATGRTHFHDVIPRNLRNAAAMFAVLREPCERFASSYDFVRRPDAYKMHPLEPVHTFKEGVDGAIEWAQSSACTTRATAWPGTSTPQRGNRGNTGQKVWSYVGWSQAAYRTVCRRQHEARLFADHEGRRASHLR